MFNIIRLITIKSIALIALLSSTQVLADETYLCNYGNKERVISVVYENQETNLPCEVRYEKEGVSEVLWSAQHQIGYCEEKSEIFVQKQISWGWNCGNVNSDGDASQAQ
ncbi:MAG: hypothetical protein ACJA04_000540 [Cellvibrionaceae bacterium]|jgi:hypothetical protein